MKSLILIAGIICLLGSGCKELDQLTQFDLDYDTQVTLPGSIALDEPVSLPTPDIETNISTRLSNYNTSPDLIESVLLKSMQFVVTQPAGQNFDFLKSIEIFIESDSLPELRIAYQEAISDTVGQILELQTSTDDLKAYLLNDVMSLRVSFVTDKLVTQEIEVDVKSVFRVDAKILGL